MTAKRLRDRARTVAKYSLVSLLLLAGIAFGVISWMRSVLPEQQTELSVAALEELVLVARDEYGIPHILASSLEDAYVALGYLHAQDRLFQMEMTRRLGQGRLSEVVGEGALEIDRLMRALNLSQYSRDSFAHFSPETQWAIDLYVQGVNAYLTHHEGAWPPEFLLLGIAPEPWRIEDTLIWSKLMAWQLSFNLAREREAMGIQALLSSRGVGENIDALEIESLLHEWFPPTRSLHPVPWYPESSLPDSVPDLDLSFLGQHEDSHFWGSQSASNIWVAGGGITDTGMPYLANDPHLSLNIPQNWYLVHMETPELRLVGGTFPGFPFMVVGHNQHLAWGLTTNGADVQDVVFEEISHELEGQLFYWVGDKTEPVMVREEEIAIRGQDPLIAELRSTRHGPVLSDLSAWQNLSAPAHHLAVLHAPSLLSAEDLTAEALYGINRARNREELLEAAQLWQVPVQNLFFADTSGDYGFVVVGRLLNRGGGGLLEERHGRYGQGVWRNFLDFDDNPRVFSPDNGYIFNANEDIAPLDYPYDLGMFYDTGGRAARLRQLFTESTQSSSSPLSLPLSLSMMQEWQNDVYSVPAQQLLPKLLGRFSRYSFFNFHDMTEDTDLAQRAGQAYNLIAAWDGQMAKESAAPLIFWQWMQVLQNELLTPLIFDEAYLPNPPSLELIQFFLTQDGREWCSYPEHAPYILDCETLLAQSFLQALTELSDRWGPDITQWQWGQAHQAPFRHALLGHIPLLRRLADRPIATAGGLDTLNRGSFYYESPGVFPHIHGAGFRATYDLSDLSNSRFILATGQSGVFFSPFYDNLQTLWQEGELIKMEQDFDVLMAQPHEGLVLMPLAKD